MPHGQYEGTYDLLEMLLENKMMYFLFVAAIHKSFRDQGIKRKDTSSKPQ